MMTIISHLLLFLTLICRMSSAPTASENECRDREIPREEIDAWNRLEISVSALPSQDVNIVSVTLKIREGEVQSYIRAIESIDKCVNELQHELLVDQQVIASTTQRRVFWGNSVDLGHALRCKTYMYRVTPLLRFQSASPFFPSLTRPLILQPKLTLKPTLVQESKLYWTQAKVIVKGNSDEECVVTGYELNCQDYRRLRRLYESPEFVVDKLMPGKKYGCKVNFVYFDSLRSDWSEIVLETREPEFVVNAHENQLLLSMTDASLLRQSSLYFYVSFVPIDESQKRQNLALDKPEMILAPVLPFKVYVVCLDVFMREQVCNENGNGNREMCGHTSRCVEVESNAQIPSKSPKFVGKDHRFWKELGPNRALIRWETPDELNGHLVGFEVSVLELCATGNNDTEEIHVENNENCDCEAGNEVNHSNLLGQKNELLIEDLKPHRRYKTLVRVINNVGASNWSRPSFAFRTRPILPINEINITRVVENRRLVIYASVPACLLSFSISVELFVQDFPVDSTLTLTQDEFSTSTIMKHSVKPGQSYNVCSRLSLNSIPECVSREENNGDCVMIECKEVIAASEKPSDGPKITLKSSTFHSLTIVLRPPREINAPGIIKSYSVLVEHRCVVEDPDCEEMRNCLIWSSFGSFTIANNESSSIIHTLSHLDPYHNYRLNISAINSANLMSPPSTLLGRTRATLKWADYALTSYSGNSFVQVRVQTPCPYRGPQVLQLQIYQNRRFINSRTLNFDLENENLHKNWAIFDHLRNGLEYTIYLTSSMASSAECTEHCSTGIRGFSVEATTSCFEIPRPTLLPEQISWSVTNDFNPFDSIKVRLQSKSFDGSQSGIQSFVVFVESQEGKSSKSKIFSQNVQWSEDNHFIIDQLEPNSNYLLYVEARGCNNNSARTDKIAVKTKQYSPGTLRLFDNFENFDNYGFNDISDDENKIWLILEDTLLNVMHGYVIYVIDDEAFESSHFFLDNGQPNEKICRNAKNEAIAANHQKTLVVPKVFCVFEKEERSHEDVIVFQQKSFYDSHVYSTELSLNTENSIINFILTLLTLVLLIGFVTFAIVTAQKKGLIKTNHFTFSAIRGLNQQQSDNRVQLEVEEIRKPLNNHNSNNVDIDNNVFRPRSKKQLLQWVLSPSFDPDTEFAQLNELEQRLIVMRQRTNEARKWTSQKQNRYGNILPYDTNRVVLKKSVLNGQCNYVNASWIRGADGQRCYIATQGPLSSSCEAFWQMVLDNDVRLIVMLTKLREKRPPDEEEENSEQAKTIVKCHQYWPGRRRNQLYGQLMVENVNELNLGGELQGLIMRKLKVTDLETCHSLHVTQLHYGGWPDHGVPSSPSSLLSLLKHVRHNWPKIDEGFVIVHCSAGVGRTGTLIGLDVVAQIIRDDHKNKLCPGDDDGPMLDVFNVVFEMRRDRRSMVQNAIQYKYLYQCVAALIQSAHNDEDERREDYYYDEDDYVYNEDDEDNDDP